MSPTVFYSLKNRKKWNFESSTVFYSPRIFSSIGQPIFLPEICNKENDENLSRKKFKG